MVGEYVRNVLFQMTCFCCILSRLLLRKIHPPLLREGYVTMGEYVRNVNIYILVRKRSISLIHRKLSQVYLKYRCKLR